MITKLLAVFIAATCGFAAHAQPTQTVDAGADLIVYNAKIHTGNLSQPEASALAVKHDRIYYVGSDAETLALQSPETELIDANSRRLIPGIIDAHTHVINDSGYNYNVRWDGVPTLERALAMLTEQAGRTPDGQWVKVIGGWSPYQFDENRFPTLEELQAAVPDHPLIVQYAYNRAYLNTLAMELLGIGPDAVPPLPNAEFERDASGRPTGVVHGLTWTFIALETMMPQLTPEEEVSSLIHVIHGLNRFGVTSVVDNGSRWGYPKGATMVDALGRTFRLNVRMPFVMLELGSDPASNMVDAQLEAITRAKPMSPGQNLYAPLAHGHEYRGAGEVLHVETHDHENFDRPAIVIEPEKLHRLVEEDVANLVERRIPFRMHTTYDENITPFLDALEALNERLPLDGLRWSLEHAETISPDNIERVRNLGGGIALDHKMALHGDAFIKTHGLETGLQTPRLRMLVDSGVPLAMTTDAYRAATFNPWVGISWMVSGTSVSGSEILAEENRLTRAEALRLFTSNAAWFMDAEAELGRVAPGNLADFSLLDRDYFAVPQEEISEISSVLTVMNGKFVFGAQEYTARSPELPPILPDWSPVGYFGGYYGEK